MDKFIKELDGMIERECYDRFKMEIKDAIRTFREQGSDKLADHLEKHIKCDDKNMTFQYTGGLQWETQAEANGYKKEEK